MTATLDQRIRGDITARIQSGEWPPGTRIPYETELAAHYGCARATVSKAMETLARAGLIERRRKAGSFVARPHSQSAVLEVPDLASVAAAKGETYRWQRNRRAALAAGEAPDIAGIAGAALAVEGVHFADDLPFAIEERWISLAAVPGCADEDFADTAPGTWLLGHVPWTHARHRIRAVAASAAEARRLAIRPGTACLSLERWTWRARDYVTYVRQLFPGDRHDLIADFDPS